jgi:hypothetical protein
MSTHKTKFKMLIANNKYKNVKINVRKINSLLHAYATQESMNQA